MMSNNWEEHINQLISQDLTPSATLQWVLNHIKQTNQKTGYAIDLGCGSGIDTIALLKEDWKVLAIDKEKSAIDYLQQLWEKDIYKEHLDLLKTTFEGIYLPPCQLVNASFSLPFCQPLHFNELWKEISSSITPDGWFSGHFFGENDAWYPNDEMTFLSAKAVQELFTEFTILSFEEVNQLGKTLSGAEKKWHVFHVVAQKK